MDVREEFVLKAQRKGCSFSALCREYRISRKTGYKWLERFRLSGWAGLESLSRKPNSSPLQVTAETVADIVAIRRAHHSWGAKKVAAVLRRTLGDKAPSVRTIARVLVRTGFVQRTKRRKPARTSVEAPRVRPCKPNDLWTVDFKGWWRTRNGQRCEPLTIRDAFSRKVLAIEVLETPNMQQARVVFERVFREFGLPDAILSDCGVPFVAPNSPVGLTRLSAWWLALGIEHHRSRPATPSDNGGHERMHRDMAEELEAHSALTRKHQQQACDRWRHDFNHHRPHEALAMKTPAEVYRRSAVEFDPTRSVEPVYPERFQTRTITSTGTLKFKKLVTYVSAALVRFPVGLEFLSPSIYALWFSHRRLGELEVAKRKFTADPWNSTVLDQPEIAVA